MRRTPVGSSLLVGLFVIALTVMAPACGGADPTTTPKSAADLPTATPTPHPFNVDESAMARISVTHMGKTVEYQKTDDGWVIKNGEDIPVHDPVWQGTPLLLSSPRPAEVASTSEDLGAYGLDDPQTRVTIVTDAGVRTSYVFGDLTPDGFSRYTVSETDDKLYTLNNLWCGVVSALATDPPYPPNGP